VIHITGNSILKVLEMDTEYLELRHDDSRVWTVEIEHCSALEKITAWCEEGVTVTCTVMSCPLLQVLSVTDEGASTHFTNCPSLKEVCVQSYGYVNDIAAGNF